jgi:hypothetical protein
MQWRARFNANTFLILQCMGPQPLRVQQTLFGSNSPSRRCSWLLGSWFEAHPCDWRCYFHWNVTAGDQNLRNITTLHQKCLRESLHSHTDTDRYTLSVDPWRRTSIIVSSWRFVLRTKRIRVITRKITVL